MLAASRADSLAKLAIAASSNDPAVVQSEKVPTTSADSRVTLLLVPPKNADITRPAEVSKSFGQSETIGPYMVPGPSLFKGTTTLEVIIHLSKALDKLVSYKPPKKPICLFRQATDLVILHVDKYIGRVHKAIEIEDPSFR
jgi:hypothetical protein